ncbi:MAG: DNA polymerase III subunit gamma/tau, partial [Ignavibacteria bacterium]
MSTYTVSARKYRPQKFSEVTSQEFVTQTMKNAVVAGKIAHSYLLSGPRGVG